MAQLSLTNTENAGTFRAALNTMFGELYTAGFAFRSTAHITSASAGTAVHVLPAATVTGSQRAYVTKILLNVNGATAWTDVTASGLQLQDTAVSPVVGVTIPKALLIGNAIIDSLATATLTVSNNILQGTGFTAAKGIDIVSTGGHNFAAGSDVYVTIEGYIA